MHRCRAAFVVCVCLIVFYFNVFLGTWFPLGPVEGCMCGSECVCGEPVGVGVCVRV